MHRSILSPDTGATSVLITSQDGTSETYDHVIMATQAHQILPLLHGASDELKTALNGE